MQDTLVHKFKWHFVWEDDREEQWLEDMARQGLHLVSGNALGMYVFRRGSPQNITYRLDFVMKRMKDPSYFQLFEDAGWEHVMQVGGWQYWRKRCAQGETAEIFTDAGSKIAKHKRILALLVACFMPMVMNLANPTLRQAFSREGRLQWVALLMSVMFVLGAYGVVRLLLRIRALRAAG
jgi:hypothetical protein